VVQNKVNMLGKIFVRDRETEWRRRTANSGGCPTQGNTTQVPERAESSDVTGSGLGGVHSPSQPYPRKLDFHRHIFHELMGKIMPDPEIVMSLLCREIIEEGTKIQVDIYRGENESGWILEVIDEENASTVWDDPFDTDREALDEVMEVIKRDGIRSFLEDESEVSH
jgi:hypothetical protein